MCAAPRVDDSQSAIRPTAGLTLEAELWAAGYRAIAGVDEVGRGPWAGPVVAAAVILPADPNALTPLLGRVDDSKRLSPRRREQLFGVIQQVALAVGVGRVEASEMDCIGIAAATRQAMAQALAALAVQPDFVLLDFLTLPEVALSQRGVPHGDALSLSIAAASIIAKVTRDRWMVEQDAIYPGYGFARHKGYGTAEHHAALLRLGPCALHRLSFAPVVAVQGARTGSAGRLSDIGDGMSEPTQDRRKALGKQGEDLAAAFLVAQGYQIITRNWRTRSGELDIVARDGDWLVFVEVRARRTGAGASVPRLGSPEESVTPRKQLQLVAMADVYLFDVKWDGLWRIDVIALELRPDGSVARMNHLRDAVGGVA